MFQVNFALDEEDAVM